MSWRERLGSYTEEVLVEQTNAGIVRRAHKNLAKVDIVVIFQDGAECTLKVGEQTVGLKDGSLTGSLCSCSATGICLHIVTAVLWAHTLAEPVQQIDLSVELKGVIEQDLFRWAGKPAVRKAAALEPVDCEVTYAETSIEICLGQSLRCRYIGGLGLDGIICDVSISRRKACITHCLLMWWRTQGLDIVWPDYINEHCTELVVSDDEKALVAQVIEALSGLLSTGVMHLSEYHPQSIRDLAWSSRGQSLPSLTGGLLRLAESIELLRQGSPKADSQQVFDHTVAAWVLCKLLANAQTSKEVADARGSFRRDYVDKALGSLWLSSVTEYETDSAKGIDLVFWDLDTRQPYTVNVGRWSESARTFSTKAALAATLGWHKGLSPKLLIGKVITLAGCKVSPDNKISQSSQTTMMQSKDMGECFENIEQLALGHWPSLMAELDAPFVVLKPTQVLPMIIDQHNQVWQGWLKDNDENWLPVTLPVNEINKHKVQSINDLIEKAGGAIWGVTTKVNLSSKALTINPLSFVLKLKSGWQVYVPGRLQAEKLERSAFEGVEQLAGKLSKPVDALLMGADFARLTVLLANIKDRLLAMAELGKDCHFQDFGVDEQLIKPLKELGCEQLANVIKTALDELTPDSLVKAAYLMDKTLLQFNLRRRVHK
jgi:hypothetical protein